MDKIDTQMQATQGGSEPKSSPRRPVASLRQLGPSEQYFWLSNQNSAKHFVIGIEVTGKTNLSSWRAGLDAVQRRHPLLQVTIGRDTDGVPSFQPLPDASIPLRVVEGTDRPAWEEEMAWELATPLPFEGAPLVRATILHRANSSVFLFTALHSVADGLSITYVLRDLLQALAGRVLNPLSLSPAQEQVRALPSALASPTSEAPSAPSVPRKPAELLNPGRSAPTVQGLRLSPEISSNLRERAREEKTTVHGALVAALVLAGHRLSETWREAPVRVISPVNTRPVVGIGEDCVLSILFPANAYDPQASGPFWDFARRVTADLAGARTAEGIGAAFEGFSRLLSTLPDVATIAAFELQVCACEMMLSNLGVLPFEETYGDLTVTAFWGPSVFVGIEGEQMFGAGTLHGAIHLLHSSYTPVPSLLATAEGGLTEALR
jgi:hypothetical protein